MQAVFCNVAALAVAGMFYWWRAYHTAQEDRERSLRARVAFMLWVMAGSAD
jgi:hypothetical protein